MLHRADNTQTEKLQVRGTRYIFFLGYELKQRKIVLRLHRTPANGNYASVSKAVTIKVDFNSLFG